MKKAKTMLTTLVFLTLTIGCDVNKDSSSDQTTKKKELIEALTETKRELDKQIEKLSSNSEKAGEVIDQVKAALTKLKAEREKVVRLIKEVNNSSVDGLKDLEKDIKQLKESLSFEFEVISEKSKEWFRRQLEEDK